MLHVALCLGVTVVYRRTANRLVFTEAIKNFRRPSRVAAARDKKMARIVIVVGASERVC